MGKLFGTDGIRGEAYRYPMDSDTAFAVGQAVTRVLGDASRGCRVVIGKDTRGSGDMLEEALQAGVASMGGTPYLAGVLPTPGVAFVARDMKLDAGVVISASHNPYRDNGIKVFSGAGYKLSDIEEGAIEDVILGGQLPGGSPQPGEARGAQRIEDAADRYAAFLKATVPAGVSLEGVSIVLDTANGAAFRVAPTVFRGLGTRLTVIHDAPNGRNINEDCGSQHTADLRRVVLERKAAIGLAFDGDGDRVIAVDEKGDVLTGDQILFICARMLKQEGRLKNDLLVSTVMSNMGLRAACKKDGFEYHATRVGDRYVLEEMRRLGGVLGGEDSGHLVFLEYHTTGDGILAAIQLLAAMVKADRPLSELAEVMEVFPQKLINVEVKSKPDLRSVPEIAQAIARVEAVLDGEGRVLVRYSGTQDMCRIMVEGPTEAITELHARALAEVVRVALG